MAARALSFGIPVMNGKGQSDDHDDQNDEFIVAHSIAPFEGQSQAPSIPSCRELCSGIILTHIYLSRQRTIPALTFVCSCGIMTAGRAVFRARHPLASSKHRNRRVGVSYTAVCLSILRNRDEQSDHRQNDHEEFIVRHAAPPPSVVTSSGR